MNKIIYSKVYYIHKFQLYIKWFLFFQTSFFTWLMFFRSLVHWDADDILHCVISGQKDWILYDYKYKQILDSVHSSEDSVSTFALF